MQSVKSKETKAILLNIFKFHKMNANNNPIREDKARDINPDEVGFEHPAKEIKAQHKIDIKESGLGREQGQTPIEEHIEPRLSQIDEGTKKMQNEKNTQKGNRLESESETGENHDAAGYMNDANSSLDRDTGDSTKEGWNAETSRTGRHK